MRPDGQWSAVSFGSNTPQLLIKARFGRTGYYIQLTDLSRIWAETLSNQEIITRAIERGCSFNPGDDDGNYDTFLKCIRSALNGKAKTTSNLRSSGLGELALDLSTPLPGGLGDLLWTIELNQLPEAAVATYIVGPLLRQANSLQSQIKQLVDEISSKDHVIQKITDGLQTSRTDLTAIFPGVSNVKTSRRSTQSQRSQFAGHVRGLADFDESAWKASHEKLSEGQQLTPDVMNTILQDLPPPQSDEQPMENWVQSLKSRSSESQTRSQVPSRTKKDREGPAIPREETQDDDFQRQETPPHLSKDNERSTSPVARESESQVTQPAQPVQNGEDSETETEDEDCLDISPTTSQQQAVSTIEPASRSGDENDDHKNRHETRSGDVDRIQSPQPDLDEETDDRASSSPIEKSEVKVETHDTESDPEPEPEKKTRKGGLGRFGGAKRKSVSPPADPEPEVEQSPAKPRGRLGKFGGKKAKSPESTPEPATSKPKPTLGRFGGKAKEESTHRSSAEESRDAGAESGTGRRSVESNAASSRRLESELEQAPGRELTEEEKQQRANEKREKLKRELEEKAAKGPAKKKIKF